ncbi:MAG: hypothetical protein J1F38_00035 [Muribaculaceae bacterium]|nr:hypothetical protein [Muribaculaceae bacterium]
MSRSSYTASERRGMIAIALVALLIIAVGLLLPLCSGNREESGTPAVVVEHAEMIDSVAAGKAPSSDKEYDNASQEKGSKKKTKKSSSSRKQTKKEKTMKEYRRRSPLDEPV